MAGLNEKERTLLALRFFENKSGAETATILGIGEWAVHKRAHRAVEKLRRFFSRRGVTLPAAALLAAIAAHSVQAAPAALAQTVTAVALTKGAAAGASTLTLIKGALKLMAWTKIKTAVIIGAGVLLAAGTTTVTVKEIKAHQSYAWQVPRAAFDVARQAPPQVTIVPAKFPGAGSSSVRQVNGKTKQMLAMGIGQSVQEMVVQAYGGTALRTTSTARLPAEKYDFLANLPQGAAEALQQEIKRQFGVVARRETRDTDVLLLQYNNPAADGLKPPDSLRQSLNAPKGAAFKSGNGEFATFSQPLFTLVNFLERRFKLPVVDQTGLTKKYDLDLTWDEPKGAEPNDDGLKQALRRQLGLELTPGRAPLEMLVVEKAK
jgi:uncharacterized protein (TIGR03435 family)